MANTTNKDLARPALGATGWDAILNSNFSILDLALGGKANLTTTIGAHTLSAAEYECLILYVTGTLTGDVTYTVPSGVGGLWIVVNATTGAYTVTFASGAGGATVAVTQGTVQQIFADGTSAVGMALPSSQSAIGNFTTVNTDTANIGTDNVTGAVTYTGVITPTALAADTNNWAPTGLSAARIIRASASSAISLTGITAQATGRELLLENVGTSNITLLPNNTNSSAANRFSLPIPYVLQPGQAIDFGLNRWPAIARSWRRAAHRTPRSPLPPTRSRSRTPMVRLTGRGRSVSRPISLSAALTAWIRALRHRARGTTSGSYSTQLRILSPLYCRRAQRLQLSRPAILSRLVRAPFAMTGPAISYATFNMATWCKLSLEPIQQLLWLC